MIEPTLAFLGPQETVIILVILLLLFGAKKLPELARGMGKSMGEFKKAREDFEQDLAQGEEEGRREMDIKDPSKKD